MACTSLTLALLLATPATADLLPHPTTDVLGPEGQDFPPGQFTDVEFGEAVAIRNGFAFIGIPNARDHGHVAVLNLTTSGWQRVATLKAPDPAAETRFGRSLTFRDGVLVVGGANAAYVFRRSNNVWTYRQKLAPGPLSIDFPLALRYEAGRLITSLRRSRFGNAIRIFEMNAAGSLVPTVDIGGFPSTPGEDFGADISMNAHEFVVGAPVGPRGRVAGLPAYDQTGSVYRFGRDRFGAWGQFQKLVPSVPTPGFGTSVAFDNEMIIVGAPKVDPEGVPGGPATPDGHAAGGAAYVFEPVGPRGQYVQTRELRPRPDEVFRYQNFGYRVAMFGSRVAIAAAEPHEAEDGIPLGLVVSYTRDGTNLSPRGVASSHLVATSMGLANNRLLVGVPFDLSCSPTCIGSARIYDVNRFAP